MSPDVARWLLNIVTQLTINVTAPGAADTVDFASRAQVELLEVAESEPEPPAADPEPEPAPR